MNPSQRRTLVPAFLLLFLRESSDYGAGLLAKLKNEMPHFLTDSTNVYRCLQELEEKGLASTNWEMCHDNIPRKWYTITEEGMKTLEDCYQEIIQRHANLSFFLIRYKTSISSK